MPAQKHSSAISLTYISSHVRLKQNPLTYTMLSQS
jgi:hypothetical protein